MTSRAATRAPHWFGTDGIRARFGEEPLVEGTVRRLGRALGEEIFATGRAPRVVLGGDTRASTPVLERWLAEGLGAAGVTAIDLGVFPTAGVSWLVPRRGAACGIVVSASHNPAADNGIKLVDGNGGKWRPADELALERRLASTPDPGPLARPRREPDSEAAAAYLAWLAEAAGSLSLAGRRVALDAANGAASRFAARLFAALGAEVVHLHDAPDGDNINRDCGSLHPQDLQRAVASGGADFGFAFDGDADRVLLVDERGELRDGDALLYLWASELARRGGLEPREIVATSMSNLGLERALAARGIGVVRCGVGDRAVVATLRERGLRLGGEQSGHLVDLATSPTGDGLLTAVILAAVLVRDGRPASLQLADFRRYPQLLVGVPVRAKPPLDSLPGVAAAAREVERRLGADGRLVLRYSGTEPLARIMLEGPDGDLLRSLSDRLAAEIRAAIGA
ncbi:MAG: phosphoglucosamine mutase [Thermoanaerobaculia bacterium]